MPADSFTLRAIARELDLLLKGGKINRVYQPERDEIALSVFSEGRQLRVLLSCNPETPRIHVTKRAKENPEVPFNFCMALRKYLTGGTVLRVGQVPYERVLFIEIENADELFDRATYLLIIEVMGRRSNIILCGGGMKMLAIAKPTPLSLSDEERSFLVGMKYRFPQNDRIEISDREKARRAIEEYEGSDGEAFIRDAFKGFSLETARHLIAAAGLEGRPIREGAEKILSAAMDFERDIDEERLNPCVLMREGVPKDIFVKPYAYFKGEELAFFPSINECADEFYCTAETRKASSDKKRKLSSAANSALKKAEKKAGLLLEKLMEADKAEYYRKCGELLVANIYLLKGGEKSVTVADYYDGMTEITIPLDSGLSPSQNAQAYFKKYNKLKNAAAQSRAQLEGVNEQISYLKSVLGYIEGAEGLEELSQIEEELGSQGLVKQQITPKRKKAEPKVPFIEVNGHTIYYGRNNVQNDYITFRLARPEDLWFHIKGEHGPHVVLKAGGKDDEQAILAAAKLAASLGEKRDRAAVDYTLKKHVRKPPGSRPGYVTYSEYKTIYVKGD